MSFKHDIHTEIETSETETSLEKLNTIHLILIKHKLI